MPEIALEKLDQAAAAIASSPASEPLGKILGGLGFSKYVTEHPGELVKQPKFQMLLDKYLPDESIVSRHMQLMASDNEPVAGKMVELAYKVKRKLGVDEDHNLNLNVNFGNQPTHAMIDGECVELSNSVVATV